MDIDRNGQVITFFSYKGGTGRTMALANVAWILASQGKRVLVVDWDLDAPGVQRFFHPFLEPELFDAADGIVDILMDYARAATQEEERPHDWHLPYARMMPRAVSLEWDFPGEGTLDVIPAGRPGRAYSTALAGFQWDNFYHRLGGGFLFAAMRDDMRRNYDYTLIDSRTGLSDIAGICTIRFPDTVVDCFTLSTQSIEGAAAVAHSIDEHDRDIRILPVPMRVEDGEQSKLENGRAMARARFAGYPRGLAKDEQLRYWGDVEIPYKTYYAYEETLATFGDEPLLPNSLLSAYERLTGALTDGAVTELPSMDERLRQRIASSFERRRPTATPDVFVSYAPEDRVWADWIRQVLEQAGVHVIIQGIGFPSGTDVVHEVRQAVATAGRVVVLLSPAYLRSSRSAVVWGALAGSETARTRPELIPIRVSDVPLTQPFDAWDTVDLAGLEERPAAETILRALGQLSPVDGYGPDPVSGARFPGTLPPVWNVPTRNASFTGRAVMLEELRDNLLRGMAVVMPQALHGLGGVGKTQLAIEFAHRFRADYDLVWWISAEQEEFITSAMADIAPQLGIRRGENTEEAADAVREALRLGRPYKRWLLVFDNAEDPERLARHLPQGTGHIMITSRNPAWSTLAVPIEVDAFSRDESVEHLTSRVSGLDPDSAFRVAQLLGDLPLAIELASAWLETTGMPVQEYLELLDNQLTTWLTDNQPRDYPQTAAATWRVSIERLGRQWPAAVRLLELCSCFSPEPISMRLLYSDETIKHLLNYDPALKERMLLARVIREIGRYALAKVDQGRSSIQVHRLVQAVIKDSMSQERIDATEHDVHRILASGRPVTGATDNPDNWASYRDIWPHLVPSNANTCVEEPVRELLVERVRYLWLRGEYEDAMTIARRLETFWLKDRGPQDRQLLYLQFHIANVLRSQGEYSAALEVDQAVLARQEAQNDEDVHALMTSGALAADLGAVGDLAGSLTRAQQTHERFRDLFGEDYPATLSAATNLSLALRLTGDCFRAREVDAATLEFRRQVLGATHPLTLHSAANLARDMREAGSFRESAALLRVTEQQFQEVLGPEFPETLRTASSLSVSLRKQGEHEEARQLSTSTLEQYRMVYKPEYPDSLACAVNLACDLSALGEAEQALELADETMEAYLRTHGPGHQYTLICANNRAIYLRSVGRFDDGLSLARDTWVALRSAFGEHHPYSLACAINVANALADSGRLDEAELMERATYESFRKQLREGHPDTLFSLGNLAITLHAQGRVDEAQLLMARSLSGLERALGADHPHIEWGRRWRRISRDLEPQPV
jgi:tetratricopeptide (TPR) repeat protein